VTRPILPVILAGIVGLSGFPALADTLPLAPRSPMMATFQLAEGLDQLPAGIAEAEKMIKESKEGKENYGAESGFKNDFGRAISAGDLDDATRAKVVDVRARMAKAGIDIGIWDYWYFDGRQLSDANKKIVSFMDQKIGALTGKFDSNTIMTAADDVVEVRKLLSKPQFQTDPDLKFYLENLAGPRLVGAMYNLGQARAAFIAQKDGFITDMMKNVNDSGQLFGAQGYAEEARDLYRAMKQDQQDTKQFTFKVDKNNPLSDDITLDAMMGRIAAALATSKKIQAAQKAADAAYEMRWKTLLKGGRASLYASEGMPNRYAKCIPKYDAADANKSSWWLYWKRIGPWQARQITYTFNAAGAIAGKQEEIIYWP
jgi:hypothetical protein